MNIKLNKKDCAITLTNDFNLCLIIPKRKKKEIVEDNVLFITAIAFLYNEENKEFYKLIENKIKEIKKIKIN